MRFKIGGIAEVFASFLHNEFAVFWRDERVDENLADLFSAWNYAETLNVEPKLAQAAVKLQVSFFDETIDVV